MVSLISRDSCQMAAFVMLTVGWIVCATSMGLPEWRVWYMDKPLLVPSGLACVGLWKVCIQHLNKNFMQPIQCYYYYSYKDSFLPLDILVPQNLMLTASTLTLLGKVLTTVALRNVYMDSPRKNVTCMLFQAAGIMSIVAGICVLVTMLWNYFCIIYEREVHFPPAFRLPSKPDVQERGGAFIVAGLATFMLIVSGMTFLTYRPPEIKEVCPATTSET